MDYILGTVVSSQLPVRSDTDSTIYARIATMGIFLSGNEEVRLQDLVDDSVVEHTLLLPRLNVTPTPTQGEWRTLRKGGVCGGLGKTSAKLKSAPTVLIEAKTGPAYAGGHLGLSGCK